MLTGNPKPETIHDFGGFPAGALSRSRIRRPARPNSPRARSRCSRTPGITAGVDGCRGLDHGAWVPLLRMYPDARRAGRADLAAARAGRRAPRASWAARSRRSRDDGVLIVGSGHTTHNLRDWMANLRRSEPLRYAQAFADWLDASARSRTTPPRSSTIANRRPDAARAHPTEEHFLPLFVAWGAAGEDARVERVVTGFEAGALAMDSWLFHPAH